MCNRHAANFWVRQALQDRGQVAEADKRTTNRTGWAALWGFLVHLISYLFTSVLLLLINLFASPQVVWAIWPLIGWGAGVLLHGLGLGIHSVRRGVPERLEHAAASDDVRPALDWERVLRRLENLEAIVTEDAHDADPADGPTASSVSTSSATAS